MWFGVTFYTRVQLFLILLRGSWCNFIWKRNGKWDSTGKHWVSLWGLLDLHYHSRTWASDSLSAHIHVNLMKTIRAQFLNWCALLGQVYQMLDLTLCFVWFCFYIRNLPGCVDAHVRNTNRFLTWPSSAFAGPHFFHLPSFLVLLSHPVVPIMFCGSLQKCVWIGTLFSSPRKQ